MKLIDLTCPHCGANLQVNFKLHQAHCDHCGSTLLLDENVQHIRYDNAEEAGYKFEQGRQRAQAENRNYYNNVIYAPKKKRRTWLWVLGWIFVFPLPLTLLLLRKKDMKPLLKYGIIAVAWILYLIIALFGNSTNSSGNITALSFNETDDITLEVGKTDSSGYIDVDVRNISDFSSDDVVFVSDNPNVATISLKDVKLSTYLYYNIEAVGQGKTTVYVTSIDGTIVSEKINVTVLKPILIEKIEITNTDKELALGDTVELSLKIYPENAKDEPISWSSSNKSVITTDKTGRITAVGGGTATITASTNNGKTASIDLVVDGSKRTMHLEVTYPRQDDINIGDEWGYITEINGKPTNKSYTLSVGDVLKYYAEFTESDENPDIGKASKSHTVTKEDLMNGFSVSMDLYVTENGGRNSGQRAHFIVTFNFIP